MRIRIGTIFNRRSRPLIGVDIGSHSIKVVEFAQKGGQRVLRRLGRALVPKGAIVDGTVKEPEAIEERLTALIKNLQPKIRRAATSVSGYSVIIKKITVPYKTERDIEDNLMFEAENYVPFEIEEVYLDFHIIGEVTTEKGKKGTEIFLVAAKKEVVDSYANIIQNVGLRPAVVDVDGFTIGNAFEGMPGVGDRGMVLLDLGASKATFSIVKGGMPLFTRDMGLSGEQLTRAVADASGLSVAEAEEIKVAGTDDPVLAGDIGPVIKQTLRAWGQEVKRAIEFFKANSSEEEYPTTMYLSGGCALMQGIEDVFEDATGLETRKFDPFKQMDKDDHIDKDYLSAVAPQFAIASGLSLRMDEL